MKVSSLAAAVVCLATASLSYAQPSPNSGKGGDPPRERLTVETPRGDVHLDVRSDAIKEVHQKDDHTFEVKVDREALRDTHISVERPK
jgi:hypothetical protein